MLELLGGDFLTENEYTTQYHSCQIYSIKATHTYHTGM